MSGDPHPSGKCPPAIPIFGGLRTASLSGWFDKGFKIDGPTVRSEPNLSRKKIKHDSNMFIAWEPDIFQSTQDGGALRKGCWLALAQAEAL